MTFQGHTLEGGLLPTQFEKKIKLLFLIFANMVDEN